MRPSTLPFESKWETMTLEYTSLPADRIGFSIVRAGCEDEKPLAPGGVAEVSVIIDDVKMK